MARDKSKRDKNRREEDIASPDESGSNDSDGSAAATLDNTGDNVPRPWNVHVRRVVSGLLFLHVAAVFIAPWSSPPPASELSGHFAEGFKPYLHAAFLYHGYRFFAPNPGPSHVCRYELELADGSRHTGQFPDVDSHWPRLLYHRHFMVSETIHNVCQVPEETPEQLKRRIDELLRTASELGSIGRYEAADRLMMAADELGGQLDTLQGPEAENILAGQQDKQLLLKGVARELANRFDAKRVRLFAVEHAIPSPQDVAAGMALDAPELYQQRLVADYSRDEL